MNTPTNPRVILADLTGCHRGKEGKALSFLLSHLDRTTPDVKVLFLFKDQAELLASEASSFELCFVESSFDRDEFLRRLTTAVESRCLTLAPGLTVELISFVPDIQVPFEKICTKGQLIGSFTRWGAFLRPITKLSDYDAEDRTNVDLWLIPRGDCCCVTKAHAK
jgi:hypothetical protein